MEGLGNIFMGLGIAFMGLAGIGLWRMPGLFMRMQATSKASTLGVILMIVGLIAMKPTMELSLIHI